MTARKSRPYYSLLVRADAADSWSQAFGDYDCRVTEQEAIDQGESHDGPTKANRKIIRTGDTQAEIQAEVDRLNSELRLYAHLQGDHIRLVTFDPRTTSLHIHTAWTKVSGIREAKAFARNGHAPLVVSKP